jgi:hypothetical protein
MLAIATVKWIKHILVIEAAWNITSMIVTSSYMYFCVLLVSLLVFFPNFIWYNSHMSVYLSVSYILYQLMDNFSNTNVTVV